VTTRFFWAASLAQVYPELAALEQDGYVVSADEPHGARPRKTYRLTDRGRAALDEWLRSERTPGFRVPRRGASAPLLRRRHAARGGRRAGQALRIRAEELDRDFRAEILPLAQEAPVRFPLLAAREGADYFSWRVAWFRQVERELADELDRQNA
jgi:DNA-binding PadR family transcriptional regulator